MELNFFFHIFVCKAMYTHRINRYMCRVFNMEMGMFDLESKCTPTYLKGQGIC